LLEALISPQKARSEPWSILVVAFLFVSFGVIVEIAFRGAIKGGMIIFAMVPAIPLIWHLVVWEEKKEEEELQKYYDTYYKIFPEKKPSRKAYPFVAYHWKLLSVFAFFFIGATLGYIFWYSVLPHEKSLELFADQIAQAQMISQKASSVSGQVVFGMVFKKDLFALLVVNNLQVLGAMFLFSLLYGIGAIYVLLWNASLIGFVIGNEVVGKGIVQGILSLFGLLPHGIFEISAWFVASIAGGILSVAIMSRHYQKPEFKYILWDIAVLTVISLELLVIGGFIESSY
jgi:uncharacterized membrane protein SpoIIM required for sporulation